MSKRTARRQAEKGGAAPGDRDQPGRTQHQACPELVEGVHAFTDGQGRPLAFLLTPGQAADCKATKHLLIGLRPRCLIDAYRAYDSNRIRDLIEEQGAVPNIPHKRNRRWKSCFSKTLYKGRNAIERMSCRLKDCRRLATRYDKPATNFLGNINLAAAMMWWL